MDSVFLTEALGAVDQGVTVKNKRQTRELRLKKKKKNDKQTVERTALRHVFTLPVTCGAWRQGVWLCCHSRRHGRHPLLGDVLAALHKKWTLSVRLGTLLCGESCVILTLQSDHVTRAFGVAVLRVASRAKARPSRYAGRRNQQNKPTVKVTLGTRIGNISAT